MFGNLFFLLINKQGKPVFMRSVKFIVTISGILLFTFLVVSSLHIKNNNYGSLHTDRHYEEGKVVYPDEYGIGDGKFNINEGIVRRGQTLSEILSAFTVDHLTIDVVSAHMKDVFSPRRIRAGNRYYAYLTDDHPIRLQYFVYEVSPLSYVKVDLTDSVYVYKGEKKTLTVRKESSGIITQSLWQTMIDNDLSFDLAMRLSEVLAWEVDFYRIERGDRFKVIYDEIYVGDSSIGIDNVYGVYFVHRGREIYGFHFQSDTIDGFYNEDGENLRKVFLKAPLKFYRITSGYSHSRLHPVSGRRRPHLGTDYAAPTGTPIMAVGDGVVTQARYTSGNGNYVRIRHNSVYETQYLHMSRFAEGIRPGRRVEQGEVIGYVGSTGIATGPHVCFRFWKNGQQVNHRRLEFPSADPLPEEYYEEFSVVRDSIRLMLDNIPLKEEEVPV